MTFKLESENAIAAYYIVYTDDDPSVWKRVRVSKQNHTLFCQQCNRIACDHTEFLKAEFEKLDTNEE